MIFIFIIAINIALWALLSSNKKYWLAILLWIILVLSVVSWRVYNDKKINQTETAYWKSADENKKMNVNNHIGNENIYKEFETRKSYVQQCMISLLHSILLQSILTFLFQLVAYKKVLNNRVYRWTAITFGIIVVVNLWVEILFAIVPSVGMLG